MLRRLPFERSTSAALVLCCAFFSGACSDGDTSDSNTGGPDGGGSAATGGSTSTGGTNDPGTGGGGDTDPGPGTGGGPVVMPPLPPNDTPETPDRENFTLLFEDHFDTLDLTRWQTASHTFDENAAQFDASMVTIEDGYLRLGLQAADSPTSDGRDYVGGELRTLDFFGYGRFEARIRFAPGSGVVSSLFTFYDHYADPDKPENWNEIDIEFLGKDNTQIQYNVIHWNAANQRTTHEKHVTTGFDPSAEFHDYAIEWLPTEVRFYIDDELVHTQTDQIEEFLTLDSRLMMNVWPVQNTPNLTSWAGTLDPASLPTAAYYDWVRVYAYTP